MLFKLALSNLTARKARVALTVAAIALSVSLVVAVTSGYKSLEATALKYLEQYMGTADAIVAPVNDLQGEVPQSLLEELAKDPAVKVDRLSGRLATERQFAVAPEKQRAAHPRPPDSDEQPQAVFVAANQIQAAVVGIQRPQDRRTENLKLTEGRWFDTNEGDVAVVDQVAADVLDAPVGGTLTLPGEHPLQLKVVGQIHKPAFFAGHQPAVYVPLPTLQKFTGRDHPPVLSRIEIDLKADADYLAFKDRWDKRLAAIDANLKLRMRRDNAGAMQRNLQGVHVLSYLGGAVSMVTATFIIFTTLVMGVTERQRTLAMLRAIGTTRGQVAKLVVIEGVLLAGLGVAVGVPMGIAWMAVLYWRFHELLAGGISISLGGIAFAAVGSALTALAASLLPAYSATRVSPLEAMNAFGSSAAGRTRPPVGWAIVGAALAAIDPLLFFGPVEPLLARFGAADAMQAAREVRFYGHFVLGLPGMMLGFFLMAPLFVWTVERACGPLAAAMLGLPYRLLRQQLSSGLWRAAGTASALMVGLATLIAMQTQGHSMLAGWQLPDHFPDIFIYSPDPVPFDDLDKVAAKINGIANHRLLPVVITTPSGDSKLQLLLASQARSMNTAVMFFGVDPRRALDMLQLDFRDDQGRSLPREQQRAAAERATEDLEKGRNIIVTDEFRQARGVKVGDAVKLLTSKHGLQPYRVCAIVWSPGVDVIINMFDMGRVMDQQTAGSVFGSIADARNDFGVTGARLFAADLQGGVPKDQLVAELKQSLGPLNLIAGDVRQIKYFIQTGLGRLLLLVSTVAFAALAVASLGVANTVMASVRTRRWQFGVLRSVGVTRGELLRLILAEALLLGAVGVALGASAGFLLSVDARQLSAATVGYAPPMTVPWGMVGVGVGAVMAVSLLASLWPAVTLARTPPLDLLQSGRAAA